MERTRQATKAKQEQTMSILVRILTNVGTSICYLLNVLVCVATLGYYLPMIEIKWICWEPLVRLRIRYMGGRWK